MKRRIGMERGDMRSKRKRGRDIHIREREKGIHTIRSLLPQRPDAQPGYTRRNYNPRGVINRSPLLQEGGKLPDQIENTPNIQIHDLGEGVVRMGVKLLPPCGTGVGEKNIDMGGLLGYF